MFKLKSEIYIFNVKSASKYTSPVHFCPPGEIVYCRKYLQDSHSLSLQNFLGSNASVVTKLVLFLMLTQRHTTSLTS